MNQYHITALEDIDVEIVVEGTRAIPGQAASRRPVIREARHWVHLARGEERDVADVVGLRGDLLGQGRPQTPAQPGESVVVHEALQITRLGSDHAGTNPDGVLAY